MEIMFAKDGIYPSNSKIVSPCAALFCVGSVLDLFGNLGNWLIQDFI